MIFGDTPLVVQCVLVESEDSINKIKIEIARLDRLIKSENNEKLIKVRFNALMSYV